MCAGRDGDAFPPAGFRDPTFPVPLVAHDKLLLRQPGHLSDAIPLEFCSQQTSMVVHGFFSPT